MMMKLLDLLFGKYDTIKIDLIIQQAKINLKGLELLQIECDKIIKKRGIK